MDFGSYMSSGTSSLISCLSLIFGILTVIGWWKLFSKAGQPGWLAIIPIVNILVYAQIAGGWWLALLLLIPVVNIFVLAYIHYSVAQQFGGGCLLALGLIFLTPVFAIWLGFGDAQYRSAKRF